MSILTEEQARAILTKVVALSKADECTAQLTGSIDGNIRFALNNISTSGVITNSDLAVQVAFGKRVGTATINQFDDASLERAVRRAEDLARLAPENPEFVPAVAKQVYKPSPTFSAATAAIDPEYRAKVAGDLDHRVQGGEADRRGLPAGRPELCRVRQLQGQFRVSARVVDGLHLHGPVRRRSRVRLGRPQPAGFVRVQCLDRHPHRHPQGVRLGRRARAGTRQIHRHPRTRGGGGAHQLHDELLRCAPGGRRTQLPVEEGRRQQGRRASI
ncbi:PmbA/TldA family metallopeptidase [Sphingomonas aurantiaca]|uniref:PmbA/TldA family metallopeptidase n=1 Tax=Sphingomonas aurantiaca TaxID=185949 RepID=UPI002FE24EF5